MTTDSKFRAQFLKLIGAEFFIFGPVFLSHDFEVVSKYELTASPVWG